MADVQSKKSKKESLFGGGAAVAADGGHQPATTCLTYEERMAQRAEEYHRRREEREQEEQHQAQQGRTRTPPGASPPAERRPESDRDNQPVRGRRRSGPRQPTWVLHNFSARAIKRTTSPAMLLVLMGSAIVWRAAAAQSRVLTPCHPPRLCGTHRPMDGCCGGGRRFQPTTACMQPSLHPVCLLRPWSQLDQCLRAGT